MVTGRLYTMRHASSMVLVCAAAALLLAATAAAAGSQQDPKTGWITGGKGVPDYNPEVWNQAYKVAIRNVPYAKDTAGWLSAGQWGVDRMGPQSFEIPKNCSAEGFDTTAGSTFTLGACFYRNTSGTTFDFWFKATGLARRNGNCYCYALDQFRGDYCKPSNDSVITCPALSKSLIRDGAQPISKEEAYSGQPKQGHYVALLAKPYRCSRYSSGDFHFLRKNADNTWSGKLPSRPPSNRDVFGQQITDPENQPVPGYYLVCGYFKLEPSKMFVKDTDREEGPLAAMSALKRYKETPGVTVDITPLPYNAATDAEEPASELRLDEGDRKFHKDKGSADYKKWVRKTQVLLELVPSSDSKEKDPCSKDDK